MGLSSESGCDSMSELNPMIEQFCDALMIEDGLAKNSLLAYRRDLVTFEDWLKSKKVALILASAS
jgi:integrase/recombinase XerD